MKKSAPKKTKSVRRTAVAKKTARVVHKTTVSAQATKSSTFQVILWLSIIFSSLIIIFSKI